jgi:hypothetical protein
MQGPMFFIPSVFNCSFLMNFLRRVAMLRSVSAFHLRSGLSLHAVRACSPFACVTFLQPSANRQTAVSEVKTSREKWG